MGHNHKLLVIMFYFCLSLVVAVATLFKRSGMTVQPPSFRTICYYASTWVSRVRRRFTGRKGIRPGTMKAASAALRVDIDINRQNCTWRRARRCYMSRQPDSNQVNWLGWQRAATSVAQHPPSHATRSSCQTFPFTLTRVAETNALFMKNNKIKRAASVNVSVGLNSPKVHSELTQL